MKLLLTLRVCVQLGHAEQLLDRTITETVSYLQHALSADLWMVPRQQLPYCSVLADKGVCVCNRSNSVSGTTRLKPISASWKLN